MENPQNMGYHYINPTAGRHSPISDSFSCYHRVFTIYNIVFSSRLKTVPIAQSVALSIEEVGSMNLPTAKPKFSHRPFQEEDLPVICRFPQTEQELFFMFPKAEYPLTVEQLKNSIEQRRDSTVILKDQKVTGFANFYLCEPGKSCTIGNVIVSPDTRGLGIGTFLINTMIEIAVKKYQVKSVELSCFNQNVSGLLLYQKLGFKPVFIEERSDKQGNRIAAIHMVFDVIPEKS
jgi:ribosomal protein S18 acetylase RimI-like enzyme